MIIMAFLSRGHKARLYPLSNLGANVTLKLSESCKNHNSNLHDN